MATRKTKTSPLPKEPVDPKDVKIMGGKVEAHLDYLVGVLSKSTLFALDKKNPSEVVALLMAKAVIRDLKANAAAHPDSKKIMAELGKILVPYLDSLRKKGGGGGGDDPEPEILQGP